MATKAQKMTDRSQTVFLECEAEAAANGGSIIQFSTNLTATTTYGIEILRLEYFLTSAACAKLSGQSDGLIMGVTQIQANPPTASTPWKVGIIDVKNVYVVGPAATEYVVISPLVTDFPEPVLAHPSSIYFVVRGINQVAVIAAAELVCRMTFRYVELTDTEYRDMLQNVLIQNVI